MQNTSQQTKYNDEIDLFDLFATVWRGKWLIIAITIAAIVLAGVYAFTAKEQWTAQAQVRVPEPRQLEQYLNIEESYHRYAMLGESVTLDTQESLEEAFTIFSTSLFAADTKLEAIENSSYYQALAQELDDDTARLKLLNDLTSKKLKASEAINNNRFIYNVQFAAETPTDAYQTLTEAITLINNKALDSLYEKQQLRIKNRILALETRSTQIKSTTEQARQNKILELEQALQSAKAAGITNYTGDSPTVGNSIIDLKGSDMLFMLGENYLQAQLSALSNSPVIYPENYYLIQQNTKNLHTLLNPKAEGHVFSYSNTPDLPLNKDKPRKGLILVLGTLLGGIVGVFYVLLRSAIRNRRNAQQA